jgi:hypothetical protein
VVEVYSAQAAVSAGAASATMHRMRSSAASRAVLLLLLMVATAAPALAAAQATSGGSQWTPLQQQQQQRAGLEQVAALHGLGRDGSQQLLPEHHQQAHVQSFQQELQQATAAGQFAIGPSSTAVRNIRPEGRPDSRILRAELATPAPTPW